MTARARNSDPSSSHDAAAHVAKKGVARRQCETVLAALKVRPGRTSNELANEAGLDRYVVARRLPELKKRGRVQQIIHKRRDRITNRWATTWRAKA
jgi:predicted HTH transcriptional regulator